MYGEQFWGGPGPTQGCRANVVVVVVVAAAAVFFIIIIIIIIIWALKFARK
jgi:hypothetical protein